MTPHAKIARQQITWQDLAAHSPVLLPCLPCGRILHHHLKTSAPFLITACDIQEDSTVTSMVDQGLRAAILPRLAAVTIPEKDGCTIYPYPWQERLR